MADYTSTHTGAEIDAAIDKITALEGETVAVYKVTLTSTANVYQCESDFDTVYNKAMSGVPCFLLLQDTDGTALSYTTIKITYVASTQMQAIAQFGETSNTVIKYYLNWSKSDGDKLRMYQATRYLIPTGGTKGQVLTKTGSSNYVYGWADTATVSKPFLISADVCNATWDSSTGAATITVTGDEDITANTAILSGVMCDQTDNSDTNTLQLTVLNLINAGNMTITGKNTIKITVFDYSSLEEALVSLTALSVKWLVLN